MGGLCLLLFLIFNLKVLIYFDFFFIRYIFAAVLLLVELMMTG